MMRNSAGLLIPSSEHAEKHPHASTFPSKLIGPRGDEMHSEYSEKPKIITVQGSYEHHLPHA